MMMYIEKTEAVEAYKLTDEFVADKNLWPYWIESITMINDRYYKIKTSFAYYDFMTFKKGNYIIKNNNVGECNPTYFESNYQLVEE